MGADGHLLFIEKDKVQDGPFAFDWVRDMPKALGWKERTLFGHDVWFMYWDTEHHYLDETGILSELGRTWHHPRYTDEEHLALRRETFPRFYGVEYDWAVENKDLIEQFNHWLQGKAEDWEVWT
jgi:hypothetical protein